MSMPWIASMPSHWSSLRAKNMFSKQSRPVREDDDVVTCFRDGMVTLRKNRRTTGFTESTQWSGYQGVRKGDLVIHVMDAFAGSIGVSDSDGKSTPVYSVCTPKMDLNSHYYAYLLREMARTGFIQSLYRGIRERSSDFRFEVFAGLFLPLPPRDEQDKIVRYLDWKVSLINKLINAKRRQVALLQESRLQIVVNAVSTDKWPLTRLGHLYDSILGKMLAPTQKTNGDTLEKYLCAKDVHFDGIDTRDNKEMWFSQTEKSQYLVCVGDLLVVEGGAGAGGSAIYTQKADYDLFVQNSVQIVRSKSDSSNEFLYYILYSMVKRGYVDYACEKATIPHFTKEKLLNTPIPVVPKHEQECIISFLDGQCEAIDKIIAKLMDEITLLSEYRTRLISDVVTGKLDVRGMTVPEYESVEETADEGNEPFDEDSMEDAE